MMDILHIYSQAFYGDLAPWKFLYVPVAKR